MVVECGGYSCLLQERIGKDSSFSSLSSTKKKKSDESKLVSYRGVTLLSTPVKMSELVVTEWVVVCTEVK